VSVSNFWRPCPEAYQRLDDQRFVENLRWKRGSLLGAHSAPALTPFKGDLFLTSRCTSLIIFGDIRFRPLEENGVRIHEERRLMSEIDNFEWRRKSEFSDLKIQTFPIDYLNLIEMPELQEILWKDRSTRLFLLIRKFLRHNNDFNEPEPDDHID
jgi:hypothetical protein